MKKYKGSATLWVIVGLVLVGGIIVFGLTQSGGQDKQEAVKEAAKDTADKVAQKADEAKEEAVKKGEEVIDQAVEEGKQKAGEVIKDAGENLPIGTAGTYEEYDAAKVAANDGALLFFHASWCPSCRALDKAITEAADSIPGGLAILKLDYDKEADLKKKYGIVGQHTLVQVDKEGNKITMWRGGNSLDEVVAKLK